MDVRNFYISPDESIIYEVLAIDKDSPEFITGIDIQPDRAYFKRHLTRTFEAQPEKLENNSKLN